MTQNTLSLRALFFEKVASAFLTLGLPIMLLVLVPVLAVLVRDYGLPVGIDVKPTNGIDVKPTNSIKKNDIERESSPEAISKAWNAVQTSNDVNTLNSFISRFPTSQYAEEARKRINNLEQAEKMQVADADASIRLVAQLLEDKDTKPALLDEFITSKGFEKRYPFGFGLFYSDGRKTLYHAGNTNYLVQFDPSTIRVLQLTATSFCFSGFSVTVKGSHLIMDGNCLGMAVGSVLHFVRLSGVSIDAESLGGSAAGAAWIIGLAP